MAEPPLLAGGFQLSVTRLFAGVPITPVGSPGEVRGTAALDAADQKLRPAALTAATRKRATTPLVAARVNVVAGEPVDKSADHVFPPSVLDCTT